MEVKNFILNQKEANVISVALSVYVRELSELGVGLDKMPELKSVVNLFSSCSFSSLKK